MNLKKYEVFFKDKSILITGGTGFIGSNAARILCNLAKETYVVTRKESQLHRIAPFINNIEVFEVELESPGSLQSIEKFKSVDYILHFAQPSHHGLKNPINNLASQNVSLRILTNVLELARIIKGVKVIHACSSTVYGHSATETNSSINESLGKRPKSYRGLIKLAERNLCLYYVRNYNINLLIGRIFRAYGPNDSEKKLIDKALIHYKNNLPVQIVNDSVKRDYIYVDDIVECILKMCMTDINSGEEINIGTGLERSAISIIEGLNDILGKEIMVAEEYYPTSDIDQNFWKADISKAKKLLKWEPETSLKEGLTNCIAFHNLKMESK